MVVGARQTRFSPRSAAPDAVELSQQRVDADVGVRPALVQRHHVRDRVHAVHVTLTTGTEGVIFSDTSLRNKVHRIFTNKNRGTTQLQV